MAASTQIITDLGTAAADVPTAASQALANAAAGPIQDLQGQIASALLKAQELQQQLTLIVTDIDAADPIKALLANVLLSLV